MDINSQIEPFVKHLKQNNRSESTIIAYKKDLEQLQNYLSNKPIAQITTKDLKQFIKYLMNDRGFTKKTTSRKINSFKTFFKFLIENNKLDNDISLSVKHPELESKLPRVLSQIEYKAIRDTARRNIRLYTIIELLLQTGARIGEISRLKTEDIKLDHDKPKMLIQEYESSDLRIVELNSVIVESLKEYLSKQKGTNSKGYLFTTRTGKQVLVRNIRTGVNRIFQKAGVNDARVNDLRNTFICHQIENGMSLERVAEIVGHKRVSSTEKYLELTSRKSSGNATNIIPL